MDPQTFIIKEMQKKLMTRFFNLGPFWSLFAELFFLQIIWQSPPTLYGPLTTFKKQQQQQQQQEKQTMTQFQNKSQTDE